MKRAALKLVPKEESGYVVKAPSRHVHKATPAQLAKMRRAKMEACMCPLCDWCLHPAVTLSEFQRRQAWTSAWNTVSYWPKKDPGGWPGKRRK